MAEEGRAARRSGGKSRRQKSRQKALSLERGRGTRGRTKTRPRSTEIYFSGSRTGAGLDLLTLAARVGSGWQGRLPCVWGGGAGAAKPRLSEALASLPGRARPFRTSVMAPGSPARTGRGDRRSGRLDPLPGLLGARAKGPPGPVPPPTQHPRSLPRRWPASPGPPARHRSQRRGSALDMMEPASNSCQI